MKYFQCKFVTVLLLLNRVLSDDFVCNVVLILLSVMLQRCCNIFAVRCNLLTTMLKRVTSNSSEGMMVDSMCSF